VFIGYIASCADVTDIRQQAERPTLFAAGVAHDLNNLLGAAFAELDMVVPRLHSGTLARQHLQSIESILTRVSEIVELLISCSTSGNTPALEAVDLSAIVEDIIHVMQGVLSRKTVQLTCKPGAHLPPILANGPQIRRVVMNLITNAVEALGSKGGSITVSTSFTHIGHGQELMKPADLQDGDYVSLSVADTGRGMTEETLSRALDPFFTTKAQGHGLGLAVVEDIVRSYGGVIRVSSTAGRGTTFEVLLPCAPESTDEQHAPREAALAGLSPRRHTSVLIVEDERMLRSATGAWLEERGFRVLYACNGEEAVQRLVDPTLDIDAVILDLTLPDVSGMEVLAKIEEVRPGAVVVLTSGHDLDADNLDDIAGDGKRVFLRKPYRLSDLVQTLSKTPAAFLNPLLRVADRNGFTNL
jgi:CheY-like chemotaxis protein